MSGMEEYRYHLFAKYEEEAESGNLVQTLYKHFSLKGKSGGGDCQVFQISSDLFCISFKSEQVRDRVLAQDQKVTTTTGVEATLYLSLQANSSLEKYEGSLSLSKNSEEITVAVDDISPAQIQIPTEFVYFDLLEPHYLKSIQEDFRDVKFEFDSKTLILQIKGSLKSVSSARRDVYDALQRLKSKTIKMTSAVVPYLRSSGSQTISRFYFLPAEIHASVEVLSDNSVEIYGLSHYDIKRAEKTLIEDLASKELQITEDEAVSVVHTNNFLDFVEKLNKSCPCVKVSIKDGGDEKPVCVLAGRKSDLYSVEEKIQEFIQEQSKTTVDLELDGGKELMESLPQLLDRLGLKHLLGSVKWNPDLEKLELTGTKKTNDENTAAIIEKTKGLKCKTVTICRPEAYSYFKADGQEFLNSLGSMLSCLAVLNTEPAPVNLQAISLFERNPAGKGNGVLFHGHEKSMCLVEDNVIVHATISDKLSELTDVIINPLCRSITGGKILKAAGSRVKTELSRTVQRSAITVTGPGDLPCRILVHIPCLCGSRTKEYLRDAIRQCQRRKFKSITVFLDMNELHQGFDKCNLAMDLIQTALKHMGAEEAMSVVFAQENFFQCFKKSAESVYNQIKMMNNMELLFFHLTPFGMSGCLNITSKPKDDPESLHRHSALCEPAQIHLFSKQYQLLDKAKAAIQRHYAGFLSTDIMVNPFLCSCGSQVRSEICQLQQKHGVNVITVDGSVVFNGLAVKTSAAREEAFELVNKAIDEKQLENKREVFRNIQWVISDDEVDPVQLSCEDSYNLEVQHTCLHEPIDMTHDNKTFTVNVAEMTAINKETSQIHPVMRTEYIVENFPGKWKMTEEENFNKVELAIDSLEYFSVERRFNETLSSKIINKIERIENKILWKRFTLDISGEVKLLFYGLKSVDVGQVEKNGFFRPPETFFSSETAQGRGIYFYVDASCAQRRCEADLRGQRVMFLGRVVTGNFTVGRKGINTPPPVNPSDPGVLYHSVVDNTNSPSVFVVFSSDRTYPEYCITFSDYS